MNTGNKSSYILLWTDRTATMEENSSVNAPSVEPQVSVEKVHTLLKTKDDTSRFVGLALLKAILDNGGLRDDPDALHLLWESISPKFLDRLLRAGQNEKVSKEEARDMVDLAVAVLHTFTILLPEEAWKGNRLTRRTAPLVNAFLKRYVYSQPDMNT